jgi:hypothetical protein
MLELADSKTQLDARVTELLAVTLDKETESRQEVRSEQSRRQGGSLSNIKKRMNDLRSRQESYLNATGY